MRIWAFLIGQRTDAGTGFEEIYRNLVDDAELAERLGYHGVLLAEHHFTNYTMVPDVLHSPLVGMTHFAVIAMFAILIAYFNVRYWKSGTRMPAAEAIG